MSNLNDFNREAKAALWVVLQWLLLAVPTGLVCGAVGTAFHLSVEYVTELRAAQSWLLLCLPLAGLAIVALWTLRISLSATCSCRWAAWSTCCSAFPAMAGAGTTIKKKSTPARG